MKKNAILFSVAVGMMMVCGQTFATLSVNFVCSGFLKNSSGSDLPSGAMVQLIWSQDATYAAPVTGSIPGVGGSYVGGDYVLYQGVTTVAGYWDTGAPRQDFDAAKIYTAADVGGSADINTGYVYAFIFLNSTPNANDYYARSGMLGSGGATSLPDASNPLNPIPKLDVTPGGSTLRLNTLQVAAVPEPSTVGLLLLGAGLVVLRRMRQA